MIDTSKAQSRGWWLKRLLERTATRRTRFDSLAAYTDGNAPLPEGADGYREAYQRFQRHSRTNFAEIIVEAVAERMSITGFRIGDGEELAKQAWRIWSVNEMGAQSVDVHDDMLTLSEGFVIVGPPEVSSPWDWLPWRKAERIPAITREDPRSVVAEHDPLMPNRVVAALKLVTDDAAGFEYAYLYLPGYVHVAKRQAGKFIGATTSGFEWDDTKQVMLPAPVVPVVHFRNRHDMGEFETHLDILNRINLMTLQRLVITVMQAYRQRAVMGDLPETDEAGTPIDYGSILKPSVGAMWILRDGQSIWESSSTDITPLITAVKSDVVMLAANSRTPLPMLLPDSQTQSAEGAVAAREGLVYKAKDRIKRATYGWNQVMQLALLFSGQPIQRDVDTLWLPPERQSLGERADASSKAQDLPLKTKLREIWGFSEAETERIIAERMDDTFAAMLSLPPATPQAAAPPVG